MKKYLSYTECEIFAAVKQDGDALRYVKEQTEAICKAAVKQSGYALQYVEKYYQSVADIVDIKEYKALKH